MWSAAFAENSSPNPSAQKTLVLTLGVNMFLKKMDREALEEEEDLLVDFEIGIINMWLLW